MASETETEALALVGQMMAYGTLQTLVAKGLFTEEDRRLVFETILMTLEDTRDVTGPVIALARRIVDGFAQIAATGKSPRTKPSPS